MLERITKLTARSLAGLIYSGKGNQTVIMQALEEAELFDKMERVELLLEEMYLVAEFSNNRNS